MKQLFIFMFFAAMTCSAFAQTDNSGFADYKIDGELIEEPQVDSLSNSVILMVQHDHFNKKGKQDSYYYSLHSFNLENKLERWSLQEVSPLLKYEFTDFGLLISEESSTCLIDYETGTKKWDLGRVFLPCFTNSEVLVGYKNPASSSLIGVSLDTGETLWKTSLAHDAGWSKVQMIDEDNFFIIANDLTRINVLTGEKKKTDCKASFVDGKRFGAVLGGAMVAGAAIGALGAAMGGYVVIPIVDLADYSKNLVRTIRPVPSDGLHISNLCSYVLMENDKLYFADRDDLRCLDPDLNEIWKTELPSRLASHSYLFSEGDRLFMVNTGSAEKSGRDDYECGHAFIATFDKNTGEQLSLEDIYGEKKRCTDVNVDSSGIYLYFEEEVVYKPFNGDMRKTKL